MSNEMIIPVQKDGWIHPSGYPTGTCGVTWAGPEAATQNTAVHVVQGRGIKSLKKQHITDR